MKRCLLALTVLCFLALGLFAVNASAESYATRADIYVTVNSDGDCLVSLSAMVHLENANTNFTFPLPPNASNITLNGESASATRSSVSTDVSVNKVTGGLAGDYTFRFDYSIAKVVTLDEDGKRLIMNLPLMSGFPYQVQAVSFVITMPGDINGTPVFSSTYRQGGIDADLDFVINGSMLTGSTKTSLNDHEAFSVSMYVEPEMFPTVSTYQRKGNPELMPMLVLAGAALVYWLIFLRTLPMMRTRDVFPPEGVTAGELGCRLTLVGGDLTMMVMTWAQLGYLIIHPDGNGRVLLHKRMDMGNERSLFEIRTFQSLFGSRRVVDCTGPRYAVMCRKTAGMLPGEKAMCKSNPIHRRVFRWICCASQVCCGVCIGMNLSSLPALAVLLSVVLGALGAVAAWQMQGMAFCLHARRKTPVWVGLGMTALWILLGFLTKVIGATKTVDAVPLIAAGSAAIQIVMGFFAAYGGRRTDLNRSEVSQILGLRRYLAKMPGAEVSRRMKSDPDFFFRMAPYAMALGIMKPFTAAFGKRKLHQCPYLVTQVHGRRSAQDWAMLMTKTAAAMDARYRQMELERWSAIRMR